jgi:hypothetical protein
MDRVPKHMHVGTDMKVIGVGAPVVMGRAPIRGIPGRCMWHVGGQCAPKGTAPGRGNMPRGLESRASKRGRGSLHIVLGTTYVELLLEGVLK